MTLESIHIKNRGPLVDFKADFGRITVIYGPNASGKSLLSNTLRAIERGEELETGEAVVTFKDRTLTSADFANVGASNRIRVFNADFLRDDVIDKRPGKIVLGSDVNDQRKEIDRLGTHISDLETATVQLTQQLSREEKLLGDQRQSAASEVKRVLRTVPVMEGSNHRWPQFDRGDALRGFESMLNEDNATLHYRSSDELDSLAETIRQRRSNLLRQIQIDDPGLPELHKRATALLRTEPDAVSLPEVDNDPSRRHWLLKGHGYANSQGHCAYCLQAVPPDRAEALDSFFSDDMTTLLRNIDDLIQGINQLDARLQAVSLPDKEEVRIDRQTDYQTVRARWVENIESAASYLATIQSHLQSKKTQPATVVEVEVEQPSWDTETSNEVNRIIADHNRSVENLLPICHEYELGMIANRFDEWKRLEDKIARLKLQINAKKQQIVELTAKLDKIKLLADANLIAASELTRMVRSFLGHDEIGFVLNDDEHSYQLTRHGEPAKHFSEGERTALALMYFLKRLEDESFEKRAGTLVFDDPITSFDEDNLFRAVSFIIDMTGVTAKKLRDQPERFIVLTHNFGLLERLWWDFRNQRADKDTNQRKARFYEMRCNRTGSQRKSELVEFDQAIITEYQVAFDEVSSITQGKTDINNPENSIRKCMEGFLRRVAPDYEAYGGALSTMRRLVDKSEEKSPSADQLRFLVTTANAGSHASATVRYARLASGWQQLKQAGEILLTLMQTVAEDHYQGMERLRNEGKKQ